MLTVDRLIAECQDNLTREQREVHARERTLAVLEQVRIGKVTLREAIMTLRAMHDAYAADGYTHCSEIPLSAAFRLFDIVAAQEGDK